LSYGTLVDAATLAAHLADPAWRIVDVRHQLADVAFGESAYAAGHIPGALFMHCDRDLSGQMNGRNGRHPLPDPASLADRFASLGIGAQTQVVVYDDSQGMIAGRLWWLLRWLGHDRVAVLDGGLQAWQAAGGSLTDAITPPPAADFVARLRDTLVDADHVRAFLQTSRLHLVDARSPDRFRGENETLDPVGGHIPGATNRFFRDNLQADGRFKPAAELRAEWLAVLAGRAPEQVVHQCGSGVSACHNILAMELAGLPGSRLYAGSWSEWCADPARPVAVG
jgi:thiosulfate/3-mercaptopyruvate sulfurtransferase